MKGGIEVINLIGIRNHIGEEIIFTSSLSYITSSAHHARHQSYNHTAPHHHRRHQRLACINNHHRHRNVAAKMLRTSAFWRNQRIISIIGIININHQKCLASAHQSASSAAIIIGWKIGVSAGSSSAASSMFGVMASAAASMKSIIKYHHHHQLIGGGYIGWHQ